MENEDPLKQFQRLYLTAKDREDFDASRAALATVDPSGAPAVRFVLVKNLEDGHFDVFTHLESPKARAMRSCPRAALAFHWASTGVQVRVSGPVSLVPTDVADAYFASRPRGSQIGAWASAQSQPLEGREALLAEVEARASEFEGKPVPRPSFWGGLRVDPERIELWHNRDDRLHDRFLFERGPGGYRRTQLCP